MVKRGIMGAWVLVGALWLTQWGSVSAQEGAPRLTAGPSQGAIPTPGESPINLEQRADTRQGGGGGGDFGAAPTETRGYRHPLDSPGTGARRGGGGGGAGPENVIPALQGNPDGVDAVPEQPSEGGGGGPTQNQPIWVNPYFMVVPDATLIPAPGGASPR